MEHVWIVYSLGGLVVGFIVGLSGVGGGSLMTPILVYFGIPPLKAVGTDLIYAAITKVGGAVVHARKKNIEWRIVGLLSLGSLPASAITLGIMLWLGLNEKNSGAVIKLVLGIALILSSVAILIRMYLSRHAARSGGESGPLQLSFWRCVGTVGLGLVLGVLVTVSSVGAGAIGAVALIFLFPKLLTTKIVGIDIAYAVPLTLIAGLGHLFFGTINLVLLVSLLVGSLPGIVAGSWLSPKAPDKVLKPIMAALLATIGFTMV